MSRSESSTREGRPNEKYSQAVRLIKIVEMMQSRGQVTVNRLVETFGVSRRTAHRDLAALQESYSIAEVGRLPDGDKTWSLTGRSRSDMLKLSVLELTALYIGKDLFNFLDGTELKEALDSVFSKVSHRLAASRPGYQAKLPTKFYCTPGVVKDYAALDDQLNAYVTALLDEQKLRLRYKKPNCEASEDIVHPLSLVVHNRTLYALAFSEQHGAIRTYAFDRIVEAEWLRGQGFVYPDEFDPMDYLGPAFGITVGDPAHVRARIVPEVREYFEKRRWHASQRLGVREGQLFVDLEVPLTPELTSWLLSFGDKLEVLEPPALRAQIARLSRGMLTLYAGVTQPNDV